jgi:hypothetical protein
MNLSEGLKSLATQSRFAGVLADGESWFFVRQDIGEAEDTARDFNPSETDS